MRSPRRQMFARAAPMLVCGAFAFLSACDDDALRGRQDAGGDAASDAGPPPLTLAIAGLDPEAMYRPHGAITLQAEATGSPVVWARFAIDGQVIGQRTEAPYRVSLPLEGIAAGRHLVVLDASSLDQRDFEQAALALHLDRSPQSEVEGALAVARRDSGGVPVAGGWWYAYAARAIGGGFRMFAVPAAGGKPKGLGAVAAGAYAASPAGAPGPDVAWRAPDGALDAADLSGDAPVVRHVAAGVAFHGYLPDGTLVYVKADRTLWAEPPGAAARKLADAADPRKVALLGVGAVLFQAASLDAPGDFQSVSAAAGAGAPAQIAPDVIWDHRDAWGGASGGFAAFLADFNGGTALGELRAAPLPAGPAAHVADGVAAGRFWLQPAGEDIAWIDGVDANTGAGQLHVRDTVGDLRHAGGALRAAYASDGSALGWLSEGGDFYLGAPEGPATTPASVLDNVADFALAPAGRAAAVASFDLGTARGTLHAGIASGMSEVSAGVPLTGHAMAPGAAHLAFVRAWNASAADGEAAVIALDANGRPTGAARALGDLAPLDAFAWSPDGAWLAVLRKPAAASAQRDAWLTSLAANSTPRKVLLAPGTLRFTAEDVYAVAADPAVAGERPLVLSELKP